MHEKKDSNSSFPTGKIAGPPSVFPQSEYVARIKRLAKALKKRGLDGVVIGSASGRLYYTGLSGSAGQLWVGADGEPVFVVDFRYIYKARAALPFARCLLQQKGGDHERQLLNFSGKWRRAGYDGREPHATIESLRVRYQKISEWEDISNLIDAQRAIKSTREQRAMRRTVDTNDKLLAAILPHLKPGISEWEIRNLFRRGADHLAQGESFDTIACVGANAADCHHMPGQEILKENDSLLLDFGVKLDFYCSDLTRCITYGKASAEYKRVHKLVLEANRRAIAAIKPGMTGAQVDEVARSFLEKAGHGSAFGHGLGHGLGLEVHETPSFSASCQTEIKPGMVLTVEPGVYLDGQLGIRIEDVVLITRDGCEVLSRTPHIISF